ncbi:MAG: DUF1189 family protein [Eubacterium sp.]|nr:DUF1189 family protein [Eubacterium sp.]
MNYFTEQNDLNKLDGISPKGPGFGKGKASILEMFVTSIIKVKNLAVTSMENRSKFVGYVIFIALLVAFMSYGVPMASKIISFGGFRNLFSEVVPQVKMEDGALKAEQTFEMKAGTINILLNTDIEEFELENLEYSGMYVTIGSQRTKMLMVTDVDDPSTYNVIYNYPNTLLFYDGFNNQSLMTMIPFIYIAHLIVFTLEAVIVAVKYLILAFVYALLTRAMTAFSKLSMTFSDAIRFCFMAQTTGILIVNTVSSFGQPLLEIIASIIGIVVTFVVIASAMTPHLADRDFIENLLNKFSGDDDDDDDDDSDDNDDDDKNNDQNNDHNNYSSDDFDKMFK